MTPKQIKQQIRQELSINERLAELIRQDAKIFADSQYRKTKDVTDHASLVRLTGVAAGVEYYIDTLLPPARQDREDKGA